jgi:rRNA maturation protein Nop10
MYMESRLEGPVPVKYALSDYHREYRYLALIQALEIILAY